MNFFQRKRFLFSIAVVIALLLTIHITINKKSNRNTATAQVRQFPLEKIYNDISTVIENDEQQNKNHVISFYIEDLTSGDSMAINNQNKFAPASMLKVGVMLAYYKLAETNPGVLTEKILFTGTKNPNSSKVFLPKTTIASGKQYTINELIEAMIIDSDNNALSLLLEHESLDTILRPYLELGIATPQKRIDKDNFMPLESYATIFRSLYNEDYLTPQYNKQALELLIKANFGRGIRGTLPSNIAVAEKFGEREIMLPDGKTPSVQLHTCGIVYIPENPYLVCVMTRGEDIFVLADIIQDISKRVYSTYLSAGLK